VMAGTRDDILRAMTTARAAKAPAVEAPAAKAAADAPQLRAVR